MYSLHAYLHFFGCGTAVYTTWVEWAIYSFVSHVGGSGKNSGWKHSDYSLQNIADISHLLVCLHFCNSAASSDCVCTLGLWGETVCLLSIVMQSWWVKPLLCFSLNVRANPRNVAILQPPRNRSEMLLGGVTRLLWKRIFIPHLFHHLLTLKLNHL